MSRQSVKAAELTDEEQGMLGLAAALVGSLLGGKLCAFVLVDHNGMFVAPLPGGEKDVLTLMANCNWAGLIRQAEEWTA